MRRAFPIALLPLTFAAISGPAAAETRQLDAHEHGTGALNVAVEGNTVVMEFEAPGHDIVGFEYEASSDADKAKIEDAIATLTSPLALFAPSEAAGCSVVEAKASLLTEDHEDHGEHGDHKDHDEHSDHDEHGDHEDHDEDHDEDHGDHDHDKDHDEDHAKDEDHDHEEHHDHDKDHDEDHDEDHAEDHDADHDHDEDHDHDAHESRHTAFEAAYQLSCETPDKLTQLALPYFQTFPNAEKLVVQVITDTGAKAVDASRAAPVVDLRGNN